MITSCYINPKTMINAPSLTINSPFQYLSFLSAFQFCENMRSQENKQSKLRQYIGAPKKFLKKARDFYVESMVNIDGMVGYSAPPLALLPTNFVVRPQKNTTEIKDFRKVGQSVSMRNTGSRKVELDKSVGVRSYSVMGLGRIGTIDEDKSCEFEEENSSVKNDFLFPRSRSYAFPKRNSGYY